MRIARNSLTLGCLALSLLVLAGCWSAETREVVVYTALDQEFSEPILDAFQRQNGVAVRAKYDVESTKTVGLTRAIIQEGSRPRCDVFWNNEILHTLRLEKMGLLAAYQSPRAERFPEQFRSPEGYWYGFAARVRVLIVNTDLVPEEQRPDSIQDLLDPQWKGKVGIAKPLFGTTATHAAVLFAAWGRERAEAFFQQLAENAEVLAGNKQVALDVAGGRLAFGLTDTDDAIIELEKGLPVEIVFPDQGDDQMGALFIPNTVAIIDGAPNRTGAEEMVDYLLSPEIEARLATGDSAQLPLAADVEQESRVAPEKPLKRMPVDFRAAADQWEIAATYLRDLFAAE
jgi:iron(III) transport system substrate-binding protein